MSMYQQFYIKQIKFELETVQPIYIQKINVGYAGWLAIEDVNIFRQDVSGYWSCLTVSY